MSIINVKRPLTIIPNSVITIPNIVSFKMLLFRKQSVLNDPVRLVKASFISLSLAGLIKKNAGILTIVQIKNNQKHNKYGEVFLKYLNLVVKHDARSIFNKIFIALLQNKANGRTYDGSIRHLKMRAALLMLNSKKYLGLRKKEKLKVNDKIKLFIEYI